MTITNVNRHEDDDDDGGSSAVEFPDHRRVFEHLIVDDDDDDDDGGNVVELFRSSPRLRGDVANTSSTAARTTRADTKSVEPSRVFSSGDVGSLDSLVDDARMLGEASRVEKGLIIMPLNHPLHLVSFLLLFPTKHFSSKSKIMERRRI